MSMKPGFQELDPSIQKMVLDDYSTYKSNKDDTTRSYTIVEKKREDGTLAFSAVLSEPNAEGYFTVRTFTAYAEDGLTVDYTIVYDIIYDADGDMKDVVRRP